MNTLTSPDRSRSRTRTPTRRVDVADSGQLDLFADSADLPPDVRARATIEAAAAVQRRADTADIARAVAGLPERIDGDEWRAHTTLRRIEHEAHRVPPKAIPGQHFAGAVTHAVRSALFTEYGTRRGIHLAAALTTVAEAWGTRDVTAHTETLRGITGLAETAGLHRQQMSGCVNQLGRDGWLTLGKRRRHVGEQVIERRRPVRPGPKLLALLAAETGASTVRFQDGSSTVRFQDSGTELDVPLPQQGEVVEVVGSSPPANEVEDVALPMCRCGKRRVTRGTKGDPNPLCRRCWDQAKRHGDAGRVLAEHRGELLAGGDVVPCKHRHVSDLADSGELNRLDGDAVVLVPVDEVRFVEQRWQELDDRETSTDGLLAGSVEPEPDLWADPDDPALAPVTFDDGPTPAAHGGASPIVAARAAERTVTSWR